MEREISNSTGTSAGVVKTTHTVHITMRNSATNRVEAGTAVVAPTASIADIIKFESLMQSLSVEGSYKGSENSIEKGKTVQTWSSGAATSILSAFGGGSSVLGSGESAFGGGAVRSLASRGDKKPFGNTSMMTIFGDICAFGACDCTDIKPGYKIKQETCCVVWEACCALDEAPYPIGFMQTEEVSERGFPDFASTQALNMR
jgi:hypothetical protein